MTDREAYELLIEYSGGEGTITRIKEMIHLVGVDKSVDNIVKTYFDNGLKIMPDEFKNWIKQSLEYISKQMEQPLN